MFATPSRVSETDFEAPYHLNRVDESDMVLRSVRSVPEIFEQTPGVVVQKTAHGQGSPYIRGFTAYNNLFLIDGIRLNNAAFRSEAKPVLEYDRLPRPGCCGVGEIPGFGSLWK